MCVLTHATWEASCCGSSLTQGHRTHMHLKEADATLASVSVPIQGHMPHMLLKRHRNMCLRCSSTLDARMRRQAAAMQPAAPAAASRLLLYMARRPTARGGAAVSAYSSAYALTSALVKKKKEVEASPCLLYMARRPTARSLHSSTCDAARAAPSASAFALL